MRILFEHPIYTSNDLHGISMFNTYRAIVEGCKKIGEPLVAYYAAPRAAKYTDRKTPIVWSETELRDIGFIPLPIGIPNPSTTAMFPLFEPELIETVKDPHFCLDAVWAGTYANALTLQIQQRRTHNRWSVPHTIPIINYWTETTIDQALVEMAKDDVCGSLAVSAATMPMAVMNDFDLEDLKRITSKYLSAAMTQRALSQAFIVPPPLNIARVDKRFEEYEKTRKARKEMVIFHGGSKEGKRHVDDLINATEIARKLGADVRLMLTTQGTMTPDRPWITVEENCNGERYLELFGEGDILWMMADYEGTGIGYMEAVRSGMLPICNSKALWIKDRIPKSYPAWVDSPKNVDNVAKMIVAIYKGRDRLKNEWQAKLIECMGRFSYDLVARQFIDGTKKAIAPWQAQNLDAAKKCFAFQFVEKAAKSGAIPDNVTLDEMYDIAKEQTDSGMALDWVPKRAMRVMLQNVGWKDTFTEKPTFVKV